MIGTSNYTIPFYQWILVGIGRGETYWILGSERLAEQMLWSLVKDGYEARIEEVDICDEYYRPGEIGLRLIPQQLGYD